MVSASCLQVFHPMTHQYVRFASVLTIRAVFMIFVRYGEFVRSPQKSEILGLIHEALKVSVLRVRNFHKQEDSEGRKSARLMDETRQIVQAARGSRPKILMTSMTPPADLKMSKSLEGTNSPMDTLAKNEQGIFKYDEFANYWLESLRSYVNYDIRPTWISIQVRSPQSLRACRSQSS